MKVLLIGMNIDGTTLGESLSAFRLAEAISRQVDTTVLCMQRPERQPLADQLPNARVVTWDEPRFFDRFGRFRAMVKPNWPILCYRVNRWLKERRAAGEHFDIAHQLVPQQMRHVTPLRHQGMPYVIGPVGGSLPTPPAFAAELEPRSMFVRLRAFDKLRFRYDWRLRATYADAAMVVGVAPYVRDILSAVPLRRFMASLEFAFDGNLLYREAVQRQPGHLRLLHVGRGVRTKGLRDVVRALALLPDLPGVTLTSAGAGAETDLCRAEADRLGVADRCRFLGLIPRDEVERLYATHDIFAFPSFREPMGGVFFEAMRWGLPIITADAGGAAAVVDETCGFRLPVQTPDQLAAAIATKVRELAADPDQVDSLGQGAHLRLQHFGTWDDKARRMIAAYRSILTLSAECAS